MLMISIRGKRWKCKMLHIDYITHYTLTLANFVFINERPCCMHFLFFFKSHNQMPEF
jgi:hypothetical protein